MSDFKAKMHQNRFRLGLLGKGRAPSAVSEHKTKFNTKMHFNSDHLSYQKSEPHRSKTQVALTT